ncbi:MAG: TIGR02117 family protein [Sphingomicrobium sp.]
MPRRRPTKRQVRRRRPAIAILLFPVVAYLAAALIGSLVPVNRGWREPGSGTTIYLSSNGVHTDIIMPVRADGLDWAPLFPSTDFADPPRQARWIAFGAGERGVYLDTPRWRDLRPRTALRAVVGGERVLHVEWVDNPGFATRELRVRPAEYRRLWAAIRADFRLDARGRPVRIDHRGYGLADAFFNSTGKIGALRTCNSWAADKLRLAGVKTSVWPPFAAGLAWRYRLAGEAPLQR